VGDAGPVILPLATLVVLDPGMVPGIGGKMSPSITLFSCQVPKPFFKDGFGGTISQLLGTHFPGMEVWV
jgi:hypothetical protein